MTHRSKWHRVRDLLPNPCPINKPIDGPNGFTLTMKPNGSIDLRHPVKLMDGDTKTTIRLDRITKAGNEIFIGYER